MSNWKCECGTENHSSDVCCFACGESCRNSTERDLAALTNRHEALRQAVAKLAEEMKAEASEAAEVHDIAIAGLSGSVARRLERILQANP